MTDCPGCFESFCNECCEMKKCGREGCEAVMCDDCSEKNTCSFCGGCRSCLDSGLIRCTSDHCNKKTCMDCNISRRGGKIEWDEESKCKCGETLEAYSYV